MPSLLLLAGRPGPWALVLIASTAVVAGLVFGAWRVEEIGARALAGRPGTTISVTGTLLEAPRRTTEGWKAAVETPEGRLLVETDGERPAGPGPGDRIEARGELREPPPWSSSGLKARGIGLSLVAGRVEFGAASRGGLSGLVDSIRARAEEGLGYGIPAPQAALARGFVLGQDQSIGPQAIGEFRDSGLAHLLAVSGQNVMLLLLLAWVLLALVGLPLRWRYPVLAALVCLYVPLTGSGPSIQRAGVMGLAGLAAASAGRPLDRVFPVALAAAITLGLNPYSVTDVGWQLSFAAVIGILALAKPFSERLGGTLGGGPTGARAALSTGIAVTVAASLATLPLIGLHFGRLPAGTVAANLIALPAVAPSMWLGMLSAVAGQLAPWLGLPFNLLNSVLLSFIGWVAGWLGGPDQVLEVGQGAPTFLVLSLVSLAAGVVIARRPAAGALVIALAIALPLTGALPESRPGLPDPPPGGVAIDVLDVGQGDAALVRTDGMEPILVDAGPPGGDVAGAVEASGLSRIGALVLTHLDRDHVGGVSEVFARFEVGSVMAERISPEIRAAAAAEGAPFRRIGLGDRFSLGRTGVEVLWPPIEGAPRPVADRNARSVVLLLESAGRRTLLTGDAEAELVPLDPGPIDVLKVAHHGSEDPGLDDLLARTGPALSLISAGEGNPYGHPVPSTVSALERYRSLVHRTDRDGSISVLIDVRGRITVETTG